MDRDARFPKHATFPSTRNRALLSHLASSNVATRFATSSAFRSYAACRGVQAGKGGMGRLGVPNTISVIALMLRFP